MPYSLIFAFKLTRKPATIDATFWSTS